MEPKSGKKPDSRWKRTARGADFSSKWRKVSTPTGLSRSCSSATCSLSELLVSTLLQQPLFSPSHGSSRVSFLIAVAYNTSYYHNWNSLPTAQLSIALVGPSVSPLLLENIPKQGLVEPASNQPVGLRFIRTWVWQVALFSRRRYFCDRIAICESCTTQYHQQLPLLIFTKQQHSDEASEDEEKHCLRTTAWDPASCA